MPADFYLFCWQFDFLAVISWM